MGGRKSKTWKAELDAEEMERLRQEGRVQTRLHGGYERRVIMSHGHAAIYFYVQKPLYTALVSRSPTSQVRMTSSSSLS